MAKGRRKALGVAVIGYGGAYDMGQYHLNEMKRVGFKLVAACDLDAHRAAVAAQEFPGISTYTRSAEMLKRDDIDLVAVLVPHNAHFKVAMQCLEAGKHVVLEKPMCLTVKEADAMIERARRKKVMLTVHHNRRHDAQIRTIKHVVDDGLLGRVFQIEGAMTDYTRPEPNDWRNNEKISGGLLFDWGAHFIDHFLRLMEGQRVTSVATHSHDGVFPQSTIKDHMSALLTFDSGATARFTVSHLMRIPLPHWRIVGETGTLEEDEPWTGIRVVTPMNGSVVTIKMDYPKDSWHEFYDGVADHLLRGKPLAVTPESARRVIAVLEAARKSDARGGAPVKVPHEEAKPARKKRK